MATNIVMPKWGLSMQKGRISQWLKREGDTVQAGEEIVEIESDKITNVVEAPAAGILAKILLPAGEEAPITDVIAIITAPGEPVPEVAAASPAAVADKAQSAAADGASAVAPVQQTKIIPAMPAARRIAKERGIDLALVRGSGPNGAITVEDVERFATPAIKPLQKVSFYSEGHRLDGLLYTPDGLAPGEQRPGVVLCAGYTYLKSLVMPDIARALSKAGYVALVFDYRGFGDSEGPRWRLIPQEQVNDARAALTFLADTAQVDSSRLAVAGLSLGGSHAISAAAQDQRVAAVVAIEAPGDGARWLRSLRRHHEWQSFMARLVADRTRRVRTGQSTRVDPLEIVLPDPDSQAFLEAVYQEFPQMKCDLPLETADALLEYSPQAWIARLAPRPVLLIHGPEDRLVPLDESQQLYTRAGEPKQLAVIPEMGHFNWVIPNHPIFAQVSTAIVSFLQKYLPVAEKTGP